MRPASEAFLRAVRGSHTMAARARLVPAGQTGTDPDGEELAILDGDVSLDATAKVRATLDLTIGSRAWPTSSADLLTPFGAGEIFVERGVKFGNGITEWVSLGYFRVDDIEQEAPGAPLRVSGSDRAAGLEDARLLAPVQFAATATLGAVLEQLVTEVYPAAVVEWDDATDTDSLFRSLVAEEDRRGFLEELVQAAGKTWAYDHRGVLVIKSPPDPASPVQELNGGEGGVLVSMGRALARKGVYNAVVVTGEAPDTGDPARAVVVDDNPESPTYFHGPFGPVPRFFSSPVITTDSQAEAAGRTMLVQALGLPYSVDLEAVPNPALEPLDPVRITYPASSRSPATRSEVHILEELKVPLTADGAMDAKTREQTLVSIGVLT